MVRVSVSYVVDAPYLFSLIDKLRRVIGNNKILQVTSPNELEDKS